MTHFFMKKCGIDIFSIILSAGVACFMSGESAFEKRHRKMVVPRGIALFGALLFIAFFVADRELISPSFPRDFVRISSRLDAWENRQEGFRLVLVSNDDRAQGFLEWGAQGLYGRVVEAKADGSARTFFLGDGGMNGIELTTAMRHGSIEVHYRPPVHPDTKGSGGLQEATVAGTRLKAADGLRIWLRSTKRHKKTGAAFRSVFSILVQARHLRRIRSMKCCGAGNRPTRWPPSGARSRKRLLSMCIRRRRNCLSPGRLSSRNNLSALSHRSNMKRLNILFLFRTTL